MIITHANWFLHPREGPQRIRRWFVYLWQFFLFFVRRVFRIRPRIHAVNIGGGPRWCKGGWRNLEEIPGIFNPEPFRLTPECAFPFDSGTLEEAYSSHCLEHLDGATVERILKETCRVLRPGATFLIKIPDYDEILEQWRRGNETYFTDYRFNYNSVRHTWKNRRLKESVDSKAALIFCGFWNDAYGHHYARTVHRTPEAYFGPPLLKADQLRDLARRHPPSAIAARLREVVKENEPSYHFNHQSAWSRGELKALLEKHGFRVESFDKRDLIRRFRHIPGIDDMDDSSLYCLARKEASS